MVQPSRQPDEKGLSESAARSLADREAEVRLDRAEYSLTSTMILSLSSLAYSIITLLAGLMVFIWAEHPLSVSVTTTVVLGVLLTMWLCDSLAKFVKYLLPKHDEGKK